MFNVFKKKDTNYLILIKFNDHSTLFLILTCCFLNSGNNILEHFFIINGKRLIGKSFKCLGDAQNVNNVKDVRWLVFNYKTDPNIKTIES